MSSVKRRKLKVVADTNILISALHFGGEAETFLGMAASRLFRLILSKYILWEMRMVLTKKLGWPEKEAVEAQNRIYEISEVINPVKMVSVIKTDAADNRILECALAARADILATNDKKHLLLLRSFRGTRIMSLKEFLAEFRPL